MTTLAKVSTVVAGYVVALLIAYGVVAIHVASTNGPDRQGASGMYAFGDSLFFLAVFGATALLPTGLGLFFLRSHEPFWRVLSPASLAIAGTALIALITYLITSNANPESPLQLWSGFAVLRILVAPAFALAFLVSALVAPTRPARLALLSATGLEAAAFLFMLLKWALLNRAP